MAKFLFRKGVILQIQETEVAMRAVLGCLKLIESRGYLRAMHLSTESRHSEKHEIRTET